LAKEVRAERVLKARVHRARKHGVGGAELLEATQTLKLGRVDELNGERRIVQRLRRMARILERFVP
jgi:hypothetical protein